MDRSLQLFDINYKRMPQIEMKPPPVKNQGAASVQITADQILKDAQIHRPQTIRPPVQRIMDVGELKSYKQEKRRQFEDKLRRQRYNLSIWVRYAQWEQNSKQFDRARSIFERSLEIDYTNKSIWLKYAEMEMKNKFINHARNVWERATYYLPRQDQFWFKYSYMEQILGEYTKARQIFRKWMEWSPGEKAWMSYIKFQERMGEPQNAKAILYQYLQAYPTLQTYLKVAKFQFKNKNKLAARNLYERVIIQLGVDALEEAYFIQFGKFQIKQRQYQRAREIFKFGLQHIPKEKANNLYEMYLNFQKQHGAKDEIDEVILGQRRNHYQKLLSQNSLNYDAWINLLCLEQSFKNIDKIRETYQEAIKHTPPAEQKRFWRRYMYIWYNYAIFQEEIAQDLERAEKVYERAIKLVPHKKFTFGKLWIFYAQFSLRCCDLQKARKIFGRAIGLSPKEKLFKAYIEIQEQLCQLDRVRSIYEKYCECFSHLPQPYIQYASFELNLQETERAKQVLNIGQKMRVEGLPDPQEFVRQFLQQNNKSNQQ